MHLARPGLALSALALSFLAPSLAASPQGTQCGSPTATNVQAVYSGGHTFITWDEVPTTTGGNGPTFGVDETYLVYQHDAPITNANIGSLTPITMNGGQTEIPENSSRFYADLVSSTEGYSNWNNCSGSFEKRHTGRLWARDGTGSAYKLTNGEGVLVLTPSSAGTRYYAVTTIPAGGSEYTCIDSGNSTGAVVELVEDPDPILLTGSNSACGTGVEVYLQYMDPLDWNVTLDAPNRLNCFYGFDDPTNPGTSNRMTKAIQYAYTYEVSYPSGTAPSEGWPTTLVLHGRGGVEAKCTASTLGSILIQPYDYVGTSWYGCDRDYDYRTANPTPGFEVYPERLSGSEFNYIVNYTQQRILRAVYDTWRLKQNVPSEAVDTNRVYVRGHSMGGGGTLSLAMQYPNVFAAAHCSKAVTANGDAVVVNDCAALGGCPTPGGGAYNVRPFLWGDPNEADCDRVLTKAYLPAFLDAEAAPWDDTLAQYDGMGFNVYQWQHHRENLQGTGTGPSGCTVPFEDRLHDEIVPFGIYHSYDDAIVSYCTQALPLYPMMNDGHRPAAAEYFATGGHTSQLGDPDGFSYGMLPPLAAASGNVPFQGHTVVRDETVPGLRLVPQTPAADACDTAASGQYLTDVDWASSWRNVIANASAPTDQNTGRVRWEMYFDNQSSAPITVDITPRRLQNFDPQLVLGQLPYIAEVEYFAPNGTSQGVVNPVLDFEERASDGHLLLIIRGVVLGPNATHRVAILPAP